MRVTKKKFEEMDEPKEIQNYLKTILARSGRKKENAKLYHYTNIDSAVSIVKDGYIWLGSINNMNDSFEKECAKNLDVNIFFTSFSKQKESAIGCAVFSRLPLERLSVHGIYLDDGKEKMVFTLNRSYNGLYVPKGMWRVMENFSTNSLALVLSSTKYDVNDYIRDYHEFLSFVGA